MHGQDRGHGDIGKEVAEETKMHFYLFTYCHGQAPASGFSHVHNISLLNVLIIQ